MLLSAHFKRSARSGASIVAALLFGFVTPQALFAANGSVAYTYDALGRIVTASYDTGVCIGYKYDPVGNRTEEKILVATIASTGVWGCFNWNNALWGPCSTATTGAWGCFDWNYAQWGP